jgi:hypothetical protein
MTDNVKVKTIEELTEETIEENPLVFARLEQI